MSAPQNTTDQNLPMLTHLGGAITCFLVPLIIYLTKKDDAKLQEHAKAAFNFQIISLFAWVIVGVLLQFIPFGTIGSLLYLGVFGFQAFFGVINAIKVNKNEPYSYPFELPLLK